MSNRRQLVIDVSTKTLVLSDKRVEPYLLPPFAKYEKIPFDVVLIKPDPDVRGQWQRLEVADISLTISMHSSLDTASPFVQQATWTKDTSLNTLSGTLDLNTSACNTYVGSNSEVTAYFEVSYIDGDGSRQKAYFASVRIVNAVTQPTSTSPDPAQEYLTAQQCFNLFLKQYNDPGVTCTFVSGSGTITRTLGVTDGAVPTDEIANA